MASGKELHYDTRATALQMAQTIFGEGITVVAASYHGDPRAAAIYGNGNATGGVAPADTGVIFSTGHAADFTQSNGDPNRAPDTSTNTIGENNTPAFNAAAGAATFDAAWLDTTLVPAGEVMTLSFTFASEEYPEYSGSLFNDSFQVWANGAPVRMSAGSGAASVNNVSQISNQNLYISNAGDAYNTEMDGFTVTLSLTIPVKPGVANTLRIGIADVSDPDYDSNVLIGAKSGQSALVAGDDAAEVKIGQSTTIDLLANDVNRTPGQITVTKINGIAVRPGDRVTLPSGEIVTLNPDGTLTVTDDGDLGPVSFTYEIGSSIGNLHDVGLVTVTTVPCFVAGTRIATPRGPRRIETLVPGDLVLTEDEGAQPLRWIGAVRVAAEGAFAPVEFAPGALGPHGRLRLSPQHRVLLRDPVAELFFGDREVLVAARDLVNGRTIRVREGGEVTYVHLLFDRHQVIRAEGMPTESFRPGAQVMGALGAAAQAEIHALFPALAQGKVACEAARPLLRAHEARALRGAHAA